MSKKLTLYSENVSDQLVHQRLEMNRSRDLRSMRTLIARL